MSTRRSRDAALTSAASVTIAVPSNRAMKVAGATPSPTWKTSSFAQMADSTTTPQPHWPFAPPVTRQRTAR